MRCRRLRVHPMEYHNYDENVGNFARWWDHVENDLDPTNRDETCHHNKSRPASRPITAGKVHNRCTTRTIACSAYYIYVSWCHFYILMRLPQNITFQSHPGDFQALYTETRHMHTWSSASTTALNLWCNVKCSVEVCAQIFRLHSECLIFRIPIETSHLISKKSISTVRYIADTFFWKWQGSVTTDGVQKHNFRSTWTDEDDSKCRSESNYCGREPDGSIFHSKWK